MDLINVLFHEAVRVSVLNKGTALSAAKYPTSGNFKLVSGVHRFAIVGIVNAVNSAITVQVQQATTASGSPKNITGAVKTISGAGADDGKWFIINVGVDRLDINNAYKYITVDISGASGSDDTVTLLLLEFGPNIPVTQNNFSEAVSVVG